MNTRLLFCLLWLTPTLCFGASSTSYFLNVEAITNVSARSAVRGLTGVFTNSITLNGDTRTAWPLAATAGNVINTGASTVGAVPRYTDTTGTNVAPSTTFNLGTSTNATLTGNLLANGGVFTNGITAGASAFNNGTLTASTPVLDVSQTWNNAGVTFTGAKFNMTSTASGNNSLIQDWQLGGVSVGFMRKDGTLAGNALWVRDDALPLYFGSSFDTRLYRDGAANTIAQRNGTSAQTLNVYNTYTDASNYRRCFIRSTGNIMEIGHEGAGTGATVSAIRIYQGATIRWALDSSGNFITGTDNTYDIGASGATRPRDVFVADDVVAGGDVTAGALLQNSGIRVMTPSTLQTLAAANALLANATKVRVVGSGGAVTLTSTPTIADGTDGQYVMIQGTDDTNTLTVQDQGSLASSNLELGAATRVLGAGDVLCLTFDSTASVWYEVSFANN